MGLRKNLQILVTVIVGSLILLLLYTGYRDVVNLYNDELKDISIEMEEISDDIVETLNSSVDHLDFINRVFVNEYDRTADEITILNNSRYLEDSNQFYADVNLQGSESSLSGLGDVATFEQEHLDEMVLAMRLTPYFELTKSHIANIEWIYYVSEREFINLYPYAPPEEFIFFYETMQNDFYQLTLPDKNPERDAIATKIYNDEAGAGLMITISRPVYQKDDFMGAVSLDFTLEELKGIVSKASGDYTDYVLVNEYGEIIAFNNNDGNPTEILSIKAYLDERDINRASFTEASFNKFHALDGVLIKKFDIDIFPWQLISVTNLSEIQKQLIGSQVVLIVMILLLIGFVVLYMKRVTSKVKAFDEQLKFEQVINQILNLMAILDINGNILFVNKTALDMVGVKSEDVVGKPFYDTPWWNWSDELIETVKAAVVTAAGGGRVREDVIHFDTEGEKYDVEFAMNPIYNQQNQIEYLVAVGKDVTDRVKLKESMNIMLKKDLLTGLGNRRAIMEKIDKEISRYRRTASPFSLLLLDVDHFKRINDSYGHNVGDDVLVELGKVLVDNVRGHDEVGRWGGEEFIVICPDTDYKEALDLASRVCKAIELFDLAQVTDVEIETLTVTIGVTVFDPQYDVKTIIRQADDALYYGKAHGRNQYVGYFDLKESK